MSKNFPPLPPRKFSTPTLPPPSPTSFSNTAGQPNNTSNLPQQKGSPDLLNQIGPSTPPRTGPRPPPRPKPSLVMPSAIAHPAPPTSPEYFPPLANQLTDISALDKQEDVESPERARSGSSNLLLEKPLLGTPASDESFDPQHYEDAMLTKSRLQFGLWASSLARTASLYVVLMGSCNVLMWLENKTRDFTWTYYFVGIYAWFIGCAIYLFENLCGTSRQASCFPWRSILYALVSIPLFYTDMTTTPGIFLGMVSLVNFAAYWRKESFSSEGLNPYDWKPLINLFRVSIPSLWNKERIGELCFMGAYIFINFYVFFYT